MSNFGGAHHEPNAYFPVSFIYNDLSLRNIGKSRSSVYFNIDTIDIIYVTMIVRFIFINAIGNSHIVNFLI